MLDGIRNPVLSQIGVFYWTPPESVSSTGILQLGYIGIKQKKV